MKTKIQVLVATELGIGLLLCGLLAATKASAATVSIYNSWNNDGVYNNPSIYPVFTISQFWEIVEIDDYHWNYGQGQDPFGIGGAIAIYDNNSGALVGSFVVTATLPGQGGVPNAMWLAYPDVSLGPGSYKIVDSDPATWSYSTTDYFPRGPDWKPYQGFSEVWASGGPPPPVPAEPATLLLLGTGLASLAGAARRKLRK